MDKEQLKIAKKIAEIEFDSANYTIRIISGAVIVQNALALTSIDYNPFGWTICGPLIGKYNVCIGRSKRGVDGIVSIGYGASIEKRMNAVHFSNNDGLPQAILECIIKAHGDK